MGNWATERKNMKSYRVLYCSTVSALCFVRAFEILTLFASRLGAVAVSAQSIMLQLCVLTFMFPLGISLATSSMVGTLADDACIYMT